jgi:hypothetical protein
MGVSYAPTPPEDSTNAVNTLVNASVTPIDHPGTLGRMGGTIYNQANKSLWIKKGASLAPPQPLTAGLPWEEVPPNSNWDIPTNWDGAIGLIWSAGVNVAGKALITELKP